MSDYYFNRELSWLKFNKRVLEEAQTRQLPLFERLKFVSIFTSNLDEFYMVRVGSLVDKVLFSADNKTGLNSKQQLEAINAYVREQYPIKDYIYDDIMKSMASIGYYQVQYNELDGGEKRLAKEHFEQEIMPLLSPQIIGSHHPFPNFENKHIYIAVKLNTKETSFYGVIPLSLSIDRIYFIPSSRKFILAEDLIYKFAEDIFGENKIDGKLIFRVTRNADVEINESLFDDDAEYVQFMREITKKRGKLSPVRLEYYNSQDPDIFKYLLTKLKLVADSCFYSASPFDLNFIGLIDEKLTDKMKLRLVYEPLKPQWSPLIDRKRSITEQIQQKDVLLSHPYNSVRPLLDLLRESAEDKNVVSIKITLYRLGKQSQIVQYLCLAAENGKDVTVVIELRARFDEQNNINWSGVLEEAGCKLIYGVDEYKVHSKIMLITRRTNNGIRHIVHLATGNYNEQTARLYTDLGLMTYNQDIASDAVIFFQNITVANVEGKYKHLLVSPWGIKNGFIELISKQATLAKEGKPARIIVKMNSFTDKNLIDAMIEASKCGVKISLIIRGICCLCPGIEGVTDNIEVISIVGRFLEHSRVYCFGEGANAKVYISSADLMTRNTEHRVEIAAPIYDAQIKEKLFDMLSIMLRDNVKASKLLSDGNYVKVNNSEEPLDSQLYFYCEAYANAEKIHNNAEYNLKRKSVIDKIKRLLNNRDVKR
jgi:polyphosphate kinase